MTATNHALTGAIIGLSIANPILALPLAFVSHFVCDALPHFGSSPEWLKTKGFIRMLVVDALLCVLLVVVLLIVRPKHWLQAAICAFLATSPDLVWINHFIRLKRHQPWRPGWFSKFASGIQWFQRPSGAVVEIVWFVGALSLLIILI